MKTTNPCPLEAKNLSKLQGVRHAFFTRQGGVSNGIYDSLNVGVGSNDNIDNVIENRCRAMRAMGRPPESLHTMYQVHSAKVIFVNGHSFSTKKPPHGDALVTDQPDLVLGVQTADCVPILLAEPYAGVTGVAHAGWRGTIVGVLSATIKGMEKLGASRQNIHAAVGPAISQKSYEVGPEFPTPFLKADTSNAKFFKPSMRPDHYMFDLPGCVVKLLKEQELASIYHLDYDTLTNDNLFFSYRRATYQREPDYGRNLSAITLGQ